MVNLLAVHLEVSKAVMKVLKMVENLDTHLVDKMVVRMVCLLVVQLADKMVGCLVVLKVGMLVVLWGCCLVVLMVHCLVDSKEMHLVDLKADKLAYNWAEQMVAQKVLQMDMPMAEKWVAYLAHLSVDLLVKKSVDLKG